MNLFQHLSQFQPNDLSNFPGNTQLRFEAFSPIFKGLFENKIVYHKRFTRLVLLENISITPERFFAFAVPLSFIRSGLCLERFYLDKPWAFVAFWRNIFYGDNHLFALYANWSIWFVSILVNKWKPCYFKISLRKPIFLLAKIAVRNFRVCFPLPRLALFQCTF